MKFVMLSDIEETLQLLADALELSAERLDEAQSLVDELSCDDRTLPTRVSPSIIPHGMLHRLDDNLRLLNEGRGSLERTLDDLLPTLEGMLPI